MNPGKKEIDLGLALLGAVALPGVCYTCKEIAAWCNCSPQNICDIELRALRKLRNRFTFADRELGRELGTELFERRQHALRPGQQRTFER